MVSKSIRATAEKKSRVTYLYDAVGMTPAAMNYTDGTFNYGSWGNVEFVKNNYPCMVKLTAQRTTSYWQQITH